MTWHFMIENIGGIRSGAASIEPGINAIRASNWQGKSSLINAIETAMGTAAPLTEGTDRGHVELSTDDDTIAVEVVRENGGVGTRGDGYLSTDRDRVCAELFAFLGDANAVRHAVRNGENLEAVLTRPLDFERIDEQIADLTQERDQIEAELERAEAAAENLPTLQEKVSRFESDLEDLREQRNDLTATVGASESEAVREELSAARAERDRLVDQQSRLKTTIANTRDRLDDRLAELEGLEVSGPGDLAADIADARDALADIERDIDLMESVYTANQRILDSGRVDLVSDVEHGLTDDAIDCWVCGHAADRATLESHLEALGDRLAELRETAESHRSQVEELESDRRAIRQQQSQRKDLQAEIDDLEATLADRTQSLDTVEDRLAELDELIEDLDARVAASNEQLTDIESEIKYTEAALKDAREELDSTKVQAEQREQLERERESIREEIEALRTRKARIKEQTRETFDQAMGTLIDRLAPGFEGARLTSNFELVVAREGREASLDALSEGEVELLGIVTALAGYETFDVAERVPIILLDDVGDFAGENLGGLVRYLAESATYVVTTAYPEQELAEDHIIDPSEWTVVSRDLSREASS